MQPLAGENALCHYILALERGDLPAIEATLQAAAQDERLGRMIAAVHASYRSEEDAADYERGNALVRSLLKRYRTGQL